MRKFLIATLVLLFVMPTTAVAHQPVYLLATDTTAAKGPLLVDGTISFAVRASFTKANQKRGFRFALKESEQLNLQYLIVNKSPENKLKSNQLPTILITSPTGSRISVKINERTKFYEPYGKTNYLYLSRYTATAESGIYKVDISSKTKAEITIAVGEKEVAGEVTREALTPSTAATPTPTPTTSTAALTMNKVRENNSASSCWSVISGNVYDLTNWISAHPGGNSAITSLCGVDGTSAFNSQHRGQSRPESRLSSFLLGKLSS
jgi:cytochrome b involved in lipid metabolism